MKELNFKEIWKAPFHSDGLYIFSSNNVMTATNFSEEKGEEILSNICKALNGEEANKYENVNVDGCELTINGVLIVIRGWDILLEWEVYIYILMKLLKCKTNLLNT